MLVYVKIKDVYYTCNYLRFNATNQKGDYKVIVIPSSPFPFIFYFGWRHTKKRKCDFFLLKPLMVNKLCRKHSFLQLDRSIRDSVRRTIRQNLSFLLQLEMLLAFIAFILFVFRVSHLGVHRAKFQIFLYFKVHPRYPKISKFLFDVLNMFSIWFASAKIGLLLGQKFCFDFCNGN